VGNEKITNKEEFILVLDEVDKEKFYKEYKKIITQKRRKKKEGITKTLPFFCV
jgi:hypothetical protein